MTVRDLIEELKSIDTPDAPVYLAVDGLEDVIEEPVAGVFHTWVEDYRTEERSHHKVTIETKELHDFRVKDEEDELEVDRKLDELFRIAREEKYDSK